jgi:surface protein
MPMSPRLLRPIAARGGFNFNPNNLVLVYDTSLEPENNTVSVPLNGTVNCTIDWGDGSSESHTTTGFKTHTYANPGVYVVQISGTMTQLNYQSSASTEDNKAKLVRCLSFGSVGLTSIASAFRNCVNLIQCPSSLPTTSAVTSLGSCFNGCANFNDARVTQWNTSSVTSMGGVFTGCAAFNQPVGVWDTSNVTQMFAAFAGATVFNQPLAGWDTSKAGSLNQFFQSALAFNQPIGTWNVSNVGTYSQAFLFNTSFDQDISGWDIRKATLLGLMNALTPWSTANYDAALIAWAALPDTDLTIGITSDTSRAITAFATLSAGTQTRVTSNAHGLIAGSRVNISGTTNYDGDYNVLAAAANTFDIAVAFVANDATGTMRHRRSRGISMSAGNTQYSSGAPAAARAVLTDTYNWTITDGGEV